MPDIARIIADSTANPWLYLPAALLLGAIHALEPGHAKSIMAAFIIAVRGTAAQAVPEPVALDRRHPACENRVPEDRLSDAAVAFEGDRRASGAA